MKLAKAVFTFILTLSLFQGAFAADAAKGEQLFANTCASCHKLGAVLIGPNLVGVESRWSDKAKLHAFIKNSQTVINSGDAYAKSLYDKYQVIMPAQQVSDEDIDDILAYVSARSPKKGGGVDAGGSAVAAYENVPADNNYVRYLVYVVVLLLMLVAYLASRVLRNSAKLRGEEVLPGGIFNLNKINSVLFPVFLVIWFVLIAYEASIHMKYVMPGAASEHGLEIDRLFEMTTWITGFVFVVTQVLLFWYVFKYRQRIGKKAYFYPHNNTVEFIWTSIPAVVLAGLVLYGFKTWQKANDNPDNNPVTIEAFAKQFDWTFRYAGKDGKLGRVNFMKITDENPLGIDFSDPAAKDDFLTTELHLPVNSDIYIKLRSRDVLHAVYMPHFRAQMYAQPGMDTRIRFKPIMTTQDMRNKLENQKFNFELACNQLCGAAHYNMRRLVVVDNQGGFDKWLLDGKTPEFDKLNGATPPAPQPVAQVVTDQVN